MTADHERSVWLKQGYNEQEVVETEIWHKCNCWYSTAQFFFLFVLHGEAVRKVYEMVETEICRTQTHLVPSIEFYVHS